MKITRSRLVEIIEQELRAVLEADGDEKDPKKGTKKPSTAAADEEPDAEETPPGGGPDPIADAPPPDGEELPTEPEDPTDGEGEDDEQALDTDGDAGEDPSGAVNDEVSGKTVQALTIEPKSKVLPGAKEVVLSFNESTDALRILVTSTGQVKFFWRGQLHDIP